MRCRPLWRQRRDVIKQCVAIFLAAVALGGAAAEAPTAPKRDRSLFAEGRQVYQQNCVVCHGHRGDGKGDMGKEVQPQPRDFRTGVFKYRTTPAGKLPTDADLSRTIRGGLSDTAMPMFNHLTERQIAAVIEYVKSYSSKWRKEENHAAPLEIPAEPQWISDPKALSLAAAKGKALFQAACAPCHGEDGAGQGTVTELNDDWGNPVPPPDLRKPYIRIGPTARDIHQILITGVNGTPMPSFLETTTEEERWQIIAFILQLRKSAAAARRNAAP